MGESKPYLTEGCKQPTPYGLFDDRFRIVTSTGNEFHIWSVELDHLMETIYEFQWKSKKIPLPELPIVTQWNMVQGAFDIYSEFSTIEELPNFINALQILLKQLDIYQFPDKDRGFALSLFDFESLLTFLNEANDKSETVKIREE